MKKTALLVIDPQMDYFPNYKYPLWNTDETLHHILEMIGACKKRAIPIILIQHIADPKTGIAPFFAADSIGVEIHPAIRSAAADARIVIKHYADSFYQTDLKQVLHSFGVESLLICGMMTQNCVTHTAISKDAEKYHTAILVDCCTSITQMIHLIALNAVSTRVPLLDHKTALLQLS